MLRRSVAIIGTRGFPSYYGGFETAVRELAPHLVQHGWDVTVYGRRHAIRADDPLMNSGVTSKITAGLDYKSLSTLSFGLTASAHACFTRPDVALVMNVANGYFLPMLKRYGIPTAVNVDGIEWERKKWGNTARRVFRKGAELTAKHADTLVFDAHAIGDYWKHHYGRDGIYIPYGGHLRGDLPVEPGLTHRGYVLVVARFVPENTIPEFFEAAQVLSETWPVVIVGSSGYRGELDQRAENLATRNPNVKWLGHISNDDRLHSLWQHAGAYFHGHSVGGTNPALVQAMALGAPTVARDTVYNREVLGQDGAFTHPEPKAIIRVIGDVMADSVRRAQLAADGKTRAQQQFSWGDINNRYENALIGLLKEGASRQ